MAGSVVPLAFVRTWYEAWCLDLWHARGRSATRPYEHTALAGEQPLHSCLQTSLVVEVVAPGAFGIVAEHTPGFLDGDA
jgi:hypothetical protein